MSRASFLVILFLWMMPASSGEAPLGETCSRIEVEDPGHDLEAYPASESPDQVYDAALDIRRVALQKIGDGLVATLTLEGEPVRGDERQTYRYWIVMEINGEYVDLRMAATTSYDSAELIGPNSQENPSLGSLPGTWNASSVQFEFPISILQDAFQKENLTIGNLGASSDGPHRLFQIQGPVGAAPYLIDRTAVHDQVIECTTEQVPQGTEVPQNAIPGPSAALLIILTGLVAIIPQRFLKP